MNFIEIHKFKCLKCGRLYELEGDEQPMRCPSILCPNHKLPNEAQNLLPWQVRKAIEEAALKDDPIVPPAVVPVIPEEAALSIKKIEEYFHGENPFIKEESPVVVPEEVTKDVIDFGTYSNDKLAEFADKAGLSKTIKKRETIIDKLTEMKFIPEDEITPAQADTD